MGAKLSMNVAAHAAVGVAVLQGAIFARTAGATAAVARLIAAV